MDLITTHTGADFDALASMVAAKKLYPDARLVFPGSQERSVREFMSLCKDVVKIESEKECSLEGVDRLIIVETRLSGRIGKIQELLDRKDISIHIYDHHPRTIEDIKADKDVFRKVGATVTILAKMIRDKGIILTPLEATIMTLGIYEDTGSLTFRTTTRQDVDMVSFLLTSGASLEVVSSFLKTSLTAKELSLLSELIKSTESHFINGVNVAICTATADRYVEELAFLTHKLLDIESCGAIFVLVKIDSKIQLIARSSTSSVDVSAIAGGLGGGGHPSASSGMIRDMRLSEAKRRLIRLLKTHIIRPTARASDIMSRPARTVTSGGSIDGVKRIMARSNIDGIPVVDRGDLTGIITRGDVEKAIRRGFGHSKVKGYMSRDVITIELETPIYQIQRIMSESGVGHLPVIKDGRLMGMVSRTDLLKGIYSGLLIENACPTLPVVANKRQHDLADRRDSEEAKEDKIRRGREMVSAQEAEKRSRPRFPKVLDVRKKMKTLLPKKIQDILRLVGRTADGNGYSAFVVGGFARDLLLGVPNFDIDIVIEGDGIGFATVLARKVGGSLVIHKKFGTAIVVMPDGFKIDVASARMEYYEYPAALPTVELSSIKQDLYRRDFTINAMAIRLNRDHFGQLVDFFDGQRDLRRKIIRVLHDLSFVDDPTRIFRAVRFEQRYNFCIDRHTQSLIKTAISLDMFERVEKQRVREEIISILSEPEPIKGIMRMAQLHELRFIHPRIKFNKGLLKMLESVREICIWFKLSFFKKRTLDTWLMYFMALVDQLSYSQAREVCDKFVFRKGDTKRILSSKRLGHKALNTLDKRTKLSPSSIYEMLRPLSYEAALLIMAKAKTQMAKRRISSFFREYNETRLAISGADLKRIGLKPGPHFKDILNAVLYAKIDGKLKSKQDELNFVKKFLRGH